jgi:hypothetical protein
VRTYVQLTRAERIKAIEKALEELLNCTANGLITFGEKLQAKIDLAIKTAIDNNMQWSTQEHILEVAKPELVVIAKGIAEDATYTDSGEFVKENEL